MTILEQLQKWSEKTGGKFETVSTINLSTDKLTLNVCGNSLEDAYEKIKMVCGDFKEEAVKEEKKEPIDLSTADLNTASTKTLAEVLGNRKIIRIYTPGTVLGAGEEVLKYQNTDYIVK